MIIEQIRYFLDGADLDPLLQARREVSRVRREQGLPAGHILLADEDQTEVPCVVWQCGYQDESEMGMVETRLIGNPDYESARAVLGEVAQHLEVEVYLVDDESEASAGT